MLIALLSFLKFVCMTAIVSSGTVLVIIGLTGASLAAGKVGPRDVPLIGLAYRTIGSFVLGCLFPTAAICVCLSFIPENLSEENPLRLLIWPVVSFYLMLLCTPIASTK